VCRSFHVTTWNNSAPAEQVFVKFDIGGIFKKFLEKNQVLLKSDKNSGYFTSSHIYICDNIMLNFKMLT